MGIGRSLMEVSALVMRQIRAGLKHREADGLTYSQVRSLIYLHGTPGASLSEVAEFLGIQAPTTSKLIDELVQAGLVRRQTAEDDRRKVLLEMTREGRLSLESAIRPAQLAIDNLLAPLGDEDRALVTRAMEVLYPLLLPGCCGERAAA